MNPITWLLDRVAETLVFIDDNLFHDFPQDDQ